MENQLTSSPNEESTMMLECISYPRLSLATGAEGTNAICSALTDILWFSDYIFPIESDLPDPVKMTVTNVNANVDLGTCSNQCSFTVEIKYDHSYTKKEILNTIKNHTHCKFIIRDDRARLFIAGDEKYDQQLISNNY